MGRFAPRAADPRKAGLPGKDATRIYGHGQTPYFSFNPRAREGCNCRFRRASCQWSWPRAIALSNNGHLDRGGVCHSLHHPAHYVAAQFLALARLLLQCCQLGQFLAAGFQLASGRLMPSAPIAHSGPIGGRLRFCLPIGFGTCVSSWRVFASLPPLAL